MMSRNFTNVYAFMQNNYPNVNVSYTNQPVSFLNKILDDFEPKDKYILVYKEAKPEKIDQNGHNNSNDVKKSPEQIVSLSESASLIGSPLKDNCEIELINVSTKSNILQFPWSPNEESYGPISAAEARRISNEVTNEDYPVQPYGTMWILCSEANDDSLIAIGNYFKKDFNTCGIIKYRNQINSNDISVQNLLNQHFSLIQRSSKLETHVESIYDLNSEMRLKFINKYSSLPSTLAITESSEVILYQNIDVSSNESHDVLGDFWSQIYLLHRIKEVIVEHQSNNYDDKETPSYPFGIGYNLEKLQESIHNILEDFKSPEEEEYEMMNNENNLEAIIEMGKNRDLTDLTDQLWNLLKYAESYGALKNAITYLFQVAIRSGIINIPTNNNRMAELLRDLAQQRLAVPNLSGTEPLELLLEIGIEKMMKDYEYIFSESNICTFKELFLCDSEETSKTVVTDPRKSVVGEPIVTQARKTLLHSNVANERKKSMETIGIKNSRFSEREVDHSISKLAQIHLILQHLLLIQKNVNLDNDYMYITKKYLEKPIVLFEKLNDNYIDRLEIPISCKKMNQLVESSAPSARKVVMRSENKYKKVENIFYYNVDLIVPPCILKPAEDNVVAENGTGKNVMYHCFHATKMSTVAL